MDYEKYRAFSPNIWNYEVWEEERLQERENQLMKSLYSKTAREIQQKVEQECDRMDYPGSMIYDEYPDKFMMEHLVSRISHSIEAQSTESGLFEELVRVLLIQEIRKRRCKNKRCRRYF